MARPARPVHRPPRAALADSWSSCPRGHRRPGRGRDARQNAPPRYSAPRASCPPCSSWPPWPSSSRPGGPWCPPRPACPRWPSSWSRARAPVMIDQAAGRRGTRRRHPSCPQWPARLDLELSREPWVACRGPGLPAVAVVVQVLVPGGPPGHHRPGRGPPRCSTPSPSCPGDRDARRGPRWQSSWSRSSSRRPPGRRRAARGAPPYLASVLGELPATVLSAEV
jgi:hypothetical protein